jgi:uncharacterized protein YndB with AHSA1/START domain
MIPNHIELEIRIDVPIETVWAVVTRPEYLVQWYASGGAFLDPRPGGNVELIWPGRGTFHGHVSKAEAPHLLAYRCAVVADQQPRPGNSTNVEFTLGAEGSATRLRVSESGFRSLETTDREKAEYVAGARSNWEAAFAGIPECVARAANVQTVFAQAPS